MGTLDSDAFRRLPLPAGDIGASQGVSGCARVVGVEGEPDLLCKRAVQQQVAD